MFLSPTPTILLMVESQIVSTWAFVTDMPSWNSLEIGLQLRRFSNFKAHYLFHTMCSHGVMRFKSTKPEEVEERTVTLPEAAGSRRKVGLCSHFLKISRNPFVKCSCLCDLQSEPYINFGMFSILKHAFQINFYLRKCSLWITGLITTL